MNDRALGELVVGLIMMCVIACGAAIAWSVQPNWTDTGKVSWVGQLTYGNPCDQYYNCSVTWYVAYAITTDHHGIFNFTSERPQEPIVDLTKGTLVGLLLQNDGNWQLEFA